MVVLPDPPIPLPNRLQHIPRLQPQMRQQLPRNQEHQPILLKPPRKSLRRCRHKELVRQHDSRLPMNRHRRPRQVPKPVLIPIRRQPPILAPKPILQLHPSKLQPHIQILKQPILRPPTPRRITPIRIGLHKPISRRNIKRLVDLEIYRRPKQQILPLA